MSLTDWARNGWLVEHRTSPQEIADLLGVADRDLRDSAVKDLSEDWRLAIGYNAARYSAPRRRWPPVATGPRETRITIG